MDKPIPTVDEPIPAVHSTEATITELRKEKDEVEAELTRLRERTVLRWNTDGTLLRTFFASWRAR